MVATIRVHKQHGETMSAKNSEIRFKALSIDSTLSELCSHVMAWIAISSFRIISNG